MRVSARRAPVLPWVALALFLAIGLCDWDNPVAWFFAAVFAFGVLVAGQKTVRRRRR